MNQRKWLLRLAQLVPGFIRARLSSCIYAIFSRRQAVSFSTETELRRPPGRQFQANAISGQFPVRSGYVAGGRANKSVRPRDRQVLARWGYHDLRGGSTG